ncbi:MAG: MerR family transcriptional regulator [Coriobacteriia bacterium]|nr:MerR family transcriptional regulator [Coriobacteriia bacterium]
MFRIGEFSKMSRTTIKALRYYDEIDLLKPEQVDEFTGYRFYSTHQLFELHKIQEYRQVGLSIDEIKLIMTGHDASGFLEKRKGELGEELIEAKTQLSRIEFILKKKEKESHMNYQATIKELPECIVYSKRMTVPSYDTYFQSIPEIGRQIGEKYPGLTCATPEYCFIINLDGEYRKENFNVEFCEAVTKVWPDYDDITFKKIPAATVVSVLHKGPYSEISNAYAYAYHWIDENNYIAIDNLRESYIDGIWNKETSQDWLTEIQIPIARK